MDGLFGVACADGVLSAPSPGPPARRGRVPQRRAVNDQRVEKPSRPAIFEEVLRLDAMPNPPSVRPATSPEFQLPQLNQPSGGGLSRSSPMACSCPSARRRGLSRGPSVVPALRTLMLRPVQPLMVGTRMVSHRDGDLPNQIAAPFQHGHLMTVPDSAPPPG